MPADELDPLYDPSLIIITFSLWAGVTWFVDALLGLAVLVVATSALTAAGLKYSTEHPRDVPFHADLGVMLVFCAAAVSSAVLLLIGFTTAPVATLVGGVAGGALVAVLWRL